MVYTMKNDGQYQSGFTGNDLDEPSVISDPIPQNQSHRRQPPVSHNKGDDITVVDVENGGTSPTSTSIEQREEKQHRNHKLSEFYRKYRKLVHAAIWAVMTAWWAAGLALHHSDKNWIIPVLLWLATSLRLLFLHIPITVISQPISWTWNNTAVRLIKFIPEQIRLWAGAAVTVAVIVVGAFASEENADNTRENRAVSLFGLAVCILALWATSRDRNMINWHTVIMGMLVQFLIALFVLRTKVGFDIFNFISTLARELLHFASNGLDFLTDPSVSELGWFLTGVVPPIIFFIALVQLLYHWGAIQWFVAKFAVFFFWSMRVSGAEAVVAAATPFVGQGESAMLIKPFVPYLTLAELHQVMACGFATIAGSVLVAYIGMGLNPQALVSSCVMSIPASLAMSKLRFPETEETLTTGKIFIPDSDEHKAVNGLHAFANGAWLGIKIAGMIISTLLVIVALLNLVSGILSWWGEYLNLTGQYQLTVELIVGYLCYPIAFLLGVPRGPDLIKVARLIGIKIVFNEYVAYKMLTTEAAYASLSPRSQLIATYSLCGFGNIACLGTQIGILSQLAPGRSGDISRVALSALCTGILSTLSSASIAGLLVQDEATYTS